MGAASSTTAAAVEAAIAAQRALGVRIRIATGEAELRVDIMTTNDHPDRAPVLPPSGTTVPVHVLAG